jgi:hypothetical protein
MVTKLKPHLARLAPTLRLVINCAMPANDLLSMLDGECYVMGYPWKWYGACIPTGVGPEQRGQHAESAADIRLALLHLTTTTTTTAHKRPAAEFGW